MSNTEDCIKPDEIGKKLDKLISNGINKILILGSPTGGKTENLIKYYGNCNNVYYIHAHKINSKYSDRNNVDKIDEIDESEIKNEIKNKEIIIIDDVYRALAMSKNLGTLKKILTQNDKTIVLVTTTHRWCWLIDEEARKIRENESSRGKKSERTNNVLRNDMELADFFLDFNEKCTSILTGYEKCDDIPKRTGSSQDNFCKLPKQYLCYHIKLRQEVEKHNDNIKKNLRRA